MKEEKNKLRKKIKEQINQLSQEEKMLQSENILKQLEELPQFKAADVILLYWSLPDEVFTHDFIKKWSGTKQILLPVINNDQLLLKLYNESSCLTVGKFNICEPDGSEFTDYSKIDLCIIPGVAFCRSGKRLGRGKGFYDKLLPNIKAYKIGICFNVQVTEDIPCEQWDEYMNKIITFK